jgi:hypothetical protein
MAFDNIIAHLDAEIARLKQVRSLLSATGKVEAKISAAKPTPAKATPKKAAKKAAAVTTATKAPAKRVLSPEARQAIADAQRKRWAAQKANA